MDLLVSNGFSRRFLGKMPLLNEAIKLQYLGISKSRLTTFQPVQVACELYFRDLKFLKVISYIKRPFVQMIQFAKDIAGMPDVPRFSPSDQKLQ